MENGGTMLPKDDHFATNATHVGAEPEQWNCHSVVPHIVLSTTFKQSGPGEHLGFAYGRGGNPTRNGLEKCLASLEGAKYGMAFCSGLAAATTVLSMFKAGDHIVSTDDLYGGTNRLLRQVTPNFGIVVDLVDLNNAKALENGVTHATKLVWIETPTNPTLKLVDIQAVVEVVKAKNPDVIVCVDNTFMSPYFQKPLAFGADMVMHSVTKYINGHSDVIMGAIMTNREDLHSRVRFLQNAVGAIPSPFDCYLVARAARTLALRMEQHQKNGLAVAKFLEQHPAVLKVNYPGLKSHPQYELAQKQMQGFSGMLSFYIKGGLQEAGTFLREIKLITLAESLGGYESLAGLPAIMTHASVPEEERMKLGVHDNLIRISVGIENVHDIIEDLKRALEAAVRRVTITGPVLKCYNNVYESSFHPKGTPGPHSTSARSWVIRRLLYVD